MRALVISMIIFFVAGMSVAGEPTDSGQREIASKLHNIQASIVAQTQAIKALNETMQKISLILPAKAKVAGEVPAIRNNSRSVCRPLAP